ncbi:DNA-binding transcriptional regulator, MarR family [Sanguibacter gelidistatuariae]|uniref:DNA-binding transcriptional regulator, MarR family n=1 Tax=Sanguibacter gelidistatuariae TaxID=1814289 RepID=A0A1G6H1E3_9MICO|nr:MarR family transcriptional regulator [Sanguibacter gelidistatuariae]SDB87206.1 DNA-binding transcriptional regulator, MarR family [Sanguibacter gelidistatuariae]
MVEPARQVEFETMLLNRHSYFDGPRKFDEHKKLDRSAYIVLTRIEIDGPLSIGELSAALGLDTSTVNRQTATMLRGGLLERIPDPDGGLARKFTMTAEGVQRLDYARSVTVDTLGRIMEEWTGEEVEAFARSLERFNRGIERLEGRPWPRPAD